MRQPDTMGASLTLPADFDVTAPDGSEVRILLSLGGGSMAHFRLDAGKVARAVRHRSVEELWYVLSGTGEMWQSRAAQQQVLTLQAGTCLSIPAGVSFQFRASERAPLAAVAVTMPPWPGADEAEFVEGRWAASVG